MGKRKLIFAITTFVLSVVSFVFLSYAWFTIDDSNKVNYLDTTIIGEKCTVDFYVLDDDTWVNTNASLNLNNFYPGDVIYFKARVTSTYDEYLDIDVINFSGITTLVSSDVLYKNNYLYVLDHLNNEIKVCDLVNNEYVVNSKVVYSYQNNTISLGEYKLEDCIYLYNLTDEDLTGISENDKTFIDGVSHTSLDSGISIDKALDSNHYIDLYFAIELNYDAMKVNGVDYSYLYMYQFLTLGRISVVFRG